MQTVLSQLNAVPGVVGSLVCNLEGQLVGQVFPPIFDVTALQDMSRTLADGATALDLSSETTDLLDVRFKEGRLLAKPFAESMLVVVCTKAANVQFLMLSVSAAVAKLDKLRLPPVPAHAFPPAAAAPAAPIVPSTRAPAGAKKVAASTSGLDELRRRLAEAATATIAPAPAEPAAKAKAKAEPEDTQATTSKKLQWWEGMS